MNTTPWALTQLALVAYIVSIAIVAKLLRTYNNPTRDTKRRATPAVVAWIALGMAPATLAAIVLAIVLWALFELMVTIGRGLVGYTHMGEKRTPQQ